MIEATWVQYYDFAAALPHSEILMSLDTASKDNHSTITPRM